MYCSRAQNRIRSQECSGIILSTEDNRHFDMCPTCPEGLRLIATVRVSLDEADKADKADYAITAPGQEDTQMDVTDATEVSAITIPATPAELAVALDVSINDIYATFKKMHAGHLPARGKASVIAERLAVWGIGPEYFCRKNRAAAVSAASPAALAPVEAIQPVAISRVEACTPGPITTLSLESLVAEIQRRLPKAVVVLR